MGLNNLQSSGWACLEKIPTGTLLGQTNSPPADSSSSLTSSLHLVM